MAANKYWGFRPCRCRLQSLFAYIFTSEAWLATHCHLPLGIFTQVSVHRSGEAIALPFSSVPLPLNSPVAIAVFPNTDTFTSPYSALSYLAALVPASASALPIVLPSLVVSMKRSAKSGSIRSGLLVCCALSHCCSKAATAFSVAAVPLFCGQAGMVSSSKPKIHHTELFIVSAPFSFCCKTRAGKACAGIRRTARGSLNAGHNTPERTHRQRRQRSAAA